MAPHRSRGKRSPGRSVKKPIPGDAYKAEILSETRRIMQEKVIRHAKEAYDKKLHDETDRMEPRALFTKSITEAFVVLVGKREQRGESCVRLPAGAAARIIEETAKDLTKKLNLDGNGRREKRSDGGE